MVETVVHSCLILNIRKKTKDGTSILIKLNLPILLDEFPMKAMGLPARLNGSGGHKGIGCIEIMG